VEPGEAIKARERSKTTKYFNFARDHDCTLVPFIMDSHGSIGRQGLDLIKDIQDEALTLPGLRPFSRISRSKFLSLLSSSWQADNVTIFNDWPPKL
jgi:hypothetical protein